MNTETWIPDGVPLDQPSPARIYDCLLGGFHNFEIDRIVVKGILQIYPDMQPAAYATRAMLRRVVNFLISQGIDQILDIGSGIPTVGNVHEIAQAGNPAARVVYVDIDPVAVAHSKSILQNDPNADAIQADLRHPAQILDHPVVNDLLDFGQPMGVLFMAVLHFVVDEEAAYAAVRTVRDAVASGSYIAILHSTGDDCPPDMYAQMNKLESRRSIHTQERTYAQIHRFFDGLELVEPGLVRPPLWRPEGPDDILLDRPERATTWAGVGCKP